MSRAMAPPQTNSKWLNIRDRLRWSLPSDFTPQLAHHVHRGLFNCGILVYSDIDRGDRLMLDVSHDIGDQVLRAKLRRGNRSWFVVDPPSSIDNSPCA